MLRCQASAPYLSLANTGRFHAVKLKQAARLRPLGRGYPDLAVSQFAEAGNRRLRFPRLRHLLFRFCARPLHRQSQYAPKRADRPSAPRWKWAWLSPEAGRPGSAGSHWEQTDGGLLSPPGMVSIASSAAYPAHRLRVFPVDGWHRALAVAPAPPPSRENPQPGRSWLPLQVRSGSLAHRATS
jgi:hypothetical protein